MERCDIDITKNNTGLIFINQPHLSVASLYFANPNLLSILSFARVFSNLPSIELLSSNLQDYGNKRK